MPAPSIAQQTGWQRPHPQTMLQGFEGAINLLERVVEWDFDLDDPGFQAYAKRRGLGDCLFPADGEDGRIARQYRSAEGIAADQVATPRYLRIKIGRLQDAWELYLAHEGKPKAHILTTGERAQHLLEETRSYGVELERHGWRIDFSNNGKSIPHETWPAWKREFNQVHRELCLLLPDLNSLMQAPECFIEVSPSNLAHQDDLPTVRAMMAMAGIEVEPEVKPTAPKPKPEKPRSAKQAEARHQARAGQIDLFGF